MVAPAPPDEHYLWLGRVISACSMLELQMGMIGWSAKTGKLWTEDFRQVAGSPGAASKLCQAAASKLDEALANELRDLMTEAEPVRQERHKYAHAVFTLDPERPAGGQWVLKSGRDPDFAPLTEAQGSDLVRTANRLSQRASQIRRRVVASVHPHDGGNAAAK
jgi:hypothetical protein